MTMTIAILISIVTLILAIFLFKKVRKAREFNLTVLFYLIVCTLFGLSLGVAIGELLVNTTPDGFTTEATAKKYIVTHINEISYNPDINNLNHTYDIDTCLMKYWDDITLSDYTDSIHIIFWGDRDSRLWGYRLDKDFWIYNTSKDPNDEAIFDKIYVLNQNQNENIIIR